MDPSSPSRAEPRTRLTRQAVVADLGQRAIAADDLDGLLHDAATTVADTLDTAYCHVLELRPGEAALRAGVGYREGLVGGAAVPTAPDSQAGYTLTVAEPVVVEDLRTEDRFSPADLLTSHGAVSGVSVTIGPAGDPWGILGTYTEDRRVFSEHDAAFVESVATVLASAVERERLRDELQRSERRYRALLENFPNGAIALVDEDLQYTIAGGTPIDGEADTGDALEGKPVAEAISDELAETLVPRYRAALDGEASRFEHEHDGNHARIHIFPVRDDDGEVFAAMGMSQDITKRKRAENDLRESEERFRTMMEQSPFSMQIFDATGRSLAVNSAWERLWDATREDVADYNVLEDEQLEAAGLLPYLRDAFAGEVVTMPETYYDPAEIDKPGRARWIEAHAYPLRPGAGETFEVALVHQDITERKEREEELKRVRERMEFALTATDAVVWDWNVDEDRASFYPSAESLYGTDVEDWDDFIDVIHPEDREKVQRGIEKALETGDAKYEEIRILRDGDVRWIEAPGQPVRDDDGPTRMIGVARDITDRKRREWRLKESNERLEQFAHAASHDLQEPLRMVSSYLQLIEQRYADALDDDADEFIEFAVDGADRMREMIDSLLAYSRIETQGEPFEGVELDDVFEDVLTDLAVRIDESRAEITAGPLPRVRGDADQLRELLQNLVANAIEYSGDGPPRVEVAAERDGRGWVISVRDDGIGIDADHHDRIFEVFERLHNRDEHGGTGIGLALCKRIVERHGGEIWVESDIGEGATFYFTLPHPSDG